MPVHCRQGSCGYGGLNKGTYPFWSVAALSLSNSFSIAGPAKGCGQCFEIKCVDIGGQFAVRTPLLLARRHVYLALSRHLRCMRVRQACCGALLPQKRVLALQGRCSKDTNQRSVTVTITDSCPECEADHLDMQALTFNKVGASLGRHH